LARSFVDHAVDRLLDLNLIDCFFDPGLKRFLYRWTYLGKLVLKKLDIKPQPPDASKKVDDEPPRAAKPSFQTMRLRDRLLCALFPDKLANH
jgi:hypothetical protein